MHCKGLHDAWTCRFFACLGTDKLLFFDVSKSTKTFRSCSKAFCAKGLCIKGGNNKDLERIKQEYYLPVASKNK